MQHLAIAKEVGNRAGEGKAYGNLGNAYHSLGDFPKAIVYHAQDLAIAQEVGDRAGESVAYSNLGACHMELGDYVNAVAYYERCHAMSTELRLALMQSQAAMGMGLALRLQVRRQDRAVTRRHRRALMIKCVRRQSGSRPPWMLVMELHDDRAAQGYLRRSWEVAPGCEKRRVA